MVRSSSLTTTIDVCGARQNNLKGFDVSLPLGKLIVVSGPSGSGKSSFAFDTLYAEGQRRYVETFSPYTRQFFDRMDKPAVDEIRGIPPAIAIEQVNAIKSTRSTVGTITDINDYLKLLLPRVVTGFCPKCSRQVQPETTASILKALFKIKGGPLLITFPVTVPADAIPAEFLSFLQQQGYQRIWISGKTSRTDEFTESLPGEIHVIQDRLAATKENEPRLTEAVETALRFGKGKMAAIAETLIHPFSKGWHCGFCEETIPEPTPGRFSFNHPLGACSSCRGFGRTITIDLARAIPDPSVSISNGAIKPFQTESGQECQRDLLKAAAKRGLDTKIPFCELSQKDREWVFLGEKPAHPETDLWKEGLWYGIRGFFNWLESKSYKMHVRVLLSRYRNYTICSECGGGRFAPSTLLFKWDGLTAPDIMRMPVSELHHFISTRRAFTSKDPTTELLTNEVQSRLGYLLEVGLGYLSLDRPTRSLSGGETARVNLTTCLGTALVNTLFVLDEPSIGLHPRDTEKLLGVLVRLRDRGNTLIVVEHEEAILRSADFFVEIGPGRGEAGGHLVYAGEAAPLISGKIRTLTGDYLTGKKKVPSRSARRKPASWISIKGASAHNVQNLDVDFPLGVLCCVTGVSGSGKSTLVHQILFKHLAKLKGVDFDGDPGHVRSIRGAEKIGSVVLVDQTPLSKTPRSSPALYIGVFDEIRDRFAQTPEAKTTGLTSSAFSFNSGTGRCERCSGSGYEKIEMQFLSDVFIRCSECEGRRYQPYIRKIKLNGASIDEVLELTVTESIHFFEALALKKVIAPLRALEEIGLGYLRLGQPLNGLSGGEAQRLKLVERLIQRSEERALLILDEPTTGLHFDDIVLLVGALNQLVEKGHSVVVIEHNPEVLRGADYIIDLGPEAGADGGLIVAKGTPQQVAACPASHTGRWLLEPSSKANRPKPKKNPFSGRDANSIQIIGARQHNLKNISLNIPRNSMSVITGLSGSGKSSLAFDLLFAEGQRRFLDSMSPYARQFANQLERPDVDRVTGLPPSVAIEQRLTRGGGKSTVATVTEVYHFLRLLFAKLGTQHCPNCHVPVKKQTTNEAVQRAEALCSKGPIKVLSTLVRARKGFHTDVAKWALRHGLNELIVDGKWETADAFPKLERFREHTIEVLIGHAKKPLDCNQLVVRALDVGAGSATLLDSRKKRHVLSTEQSCPFCNTSFEDLDPRLFSFNSPHGWCESCHGFGQSWDRKDNPRLDSALEIELDHERQHDALELDHLRNCETCGGARLNPVARSVKISNASIHEAISNPADHLLKWVTSLNFSGSNKQIAADIIPEISQRLQFLGDVGLGYLSLDRSANTLSGGESQRIRLAAQLGSNLRGVLYVLDEPTIGLHPRDNAALLDTLEALKDKGNSLVIVEHDEDTLRRAEHIIDLGPGAGRFGGKIMAQGTLNDITKSDQSATGACLRKPLLHPMRGERRPVTSKHSLGWIRIKGASLHNIKDLDASIPIGRLTVLSGISGSGKSTFMRGILKPSIEAALQKGKKRSLPANSNILFKSLSGADLIEAVYEVDQAPIGKTSRSTPATYLGIFDEIRNLFASTPSARMRGYAAGRFSFNTEGGRCETCLGQGMTKIEMNFLPSAYITCTECHGHRYNDATLEIAYKGRTIADVLGMPIEEAAGFFESQSALRRPLKLLCDTGLGYLTLGQPSQTLSGGEAQRLKLVSELVRGVSRSENSKLRSSKVLKSMLYLLEEPTIGLHQADVRQLLGVLHQLVDAGNTVVVIEHHTAVISEADHVLEMGPEAGAGGGKLIASGTPESLLKVKMSRIAPFLGSLRTR